MPLSPRVLTDELARAEALMADVIRRAGHGADPRLERRLDSQAHALRALLDARDAAVVGDAFDAARRVLGAADPAAPLLMLAIARRNLARVVRRHAARAPLNDAA